MFSPSSRAELRDWLVELARADDQVTAVAVLGSGAHGGEDLWSDIDLALRLAPGADVSSVADAWSARLRQRTEPVASVDVWARRALYRVFLLADTLQLDVSFWPDDAFAAHGPRFRLLFGEANQPVQVTSAEPHELLGLAWLYALHVRSSLARGKQWQAVYMLNATRERVIELACLRHGLATSEGRGVDDLPPALTAELATTWPAAAELDDLRRAFPRVVTLVLAEAEHVDPSVATRLRPVLTELVTSVSSPDL